MPFPWKKGKVNRISRLVADLQSPKHGGSLVVQTGFPTSLIDLFVKNQDRLKKPSKKKSARLGCDIARPPPSNLPNSISSWRGAAPASTEIKAPTDRYGVESAIGDGGVAKSALGGDGVVACTKLEATDRVSGVNGIVATVVKIFLVVVLALGTKKLAVGITMSAFLMFFLEYLGKYIFRSRRQFLAEQIRLKHLIQNVLSLVQRKHDVLAVEKIQQEKSLAFNSSDLIEGREFTTSTDEIQIVETNSNSVCSGEEIQIADPSFDFLSREKRWGSKELSSGKMVMQIYEDDIEVSGLQKHRSKMLKSKIIKKLVPKKLQRSKKWGKSKQKEEELSHEGHGLLHGREEQEQEEDEGEGDSIEKDKFMASSTKEEYEEEEEEEEERSYESEETEVTTSSAGEWSKVDAGTAEDQKKARGKTMEKSGYLILLVIVLSGLLGGRILALGLTIAWLMVLKLVEILRRFMNTMINSCV